MSMPLNPNRPPCPNCGSTHVQSRAPDWGCCDCRHRWPQKPREVRPVRVPKILTVDIETAPIELYTWGLYKQRPGPHQILKDWCMLSWSAKWLFDPEVMGQHIGPDEAFERRDGSIMQGIWNLLEEADIVVGHNVTRFDVRKVNARLKLNGYTPPMPYQHIDTMRHTQKNFAYPSYALNYLNGIFNLHQKAKTEEGLWKKCIRADNTTKLQQMKALGDMLKYNKQDVLITEELYLDIRPWMKSHPNLNLLYDGEFVERCPNCGSTFLDWRGEYTTPMNIYCAFRCKACGAIGRARVGNISKAKREVLTSSVAR